MGETTMNMNSILGALASIGINSTIVGRALINASTSAAQRLLLDTAKTDLSDLTTKTALELGDYLDLAYAFAPEIDTPVITQATSNATALSSPVVYKPYICGTGSAISNSDGQGDTYIRFAPGTFYTANGGSNDLAMYGQTKPGGTAQWAKWPVIASFTTASSVSVVEVGSYSQDNNDTLMPLIEVNGRFVNDVAIRRTVTGNDWKFTLTFPTPKVRTIKIYAVGSFGLTAIRVPTGQSISKPSAPTKTIAFIGDSFVNGAGSGLDAGAGIAETFAVRLARLMGADSVLLAGIGGTGFTAGSTTNNYLTRASYVVGKAPNILIVNGSINDGVGAGTLAADIADFLAAVSTITRVIVVGTMATGYESNHDAVKTATELAGREFVDMRSFLKSGNYGVYRYSDNTHPSTQGHKAIARAVFRKIGF